MEINLLKFLKYINLSLVLSLSANANSMFTYEQFQDANHTFDIAVKEKLSDCIRNHDNNRIVNKLVELRIYELPILKVNEDDLQLFGINNNNVKNIVNQINTLKNDLENEINDKILPALRYDDLEDNEQQILNDKMGIIQNALKEIKSSNFTKDMYTQLVNYKLISNPNNNLSEIEQILNMQKSFGEILYKIKYEQNLEEKNELIKSFYLHLVGNEFNNLDMLINYANQNVLNNINEILDIQEVKDYIQSYNLDKLDLNIIIPAARVDFVNYDGFKIDFSKTLQENKETCFDLYKEYIEKLSYEDIKKFKNIITNIYQNNKDDIQKSIIEKLKNYYNSKKELINNKVIQQANDEYENLFKEAWDKQFKSQPLNKLLNDDFNLDTIQEEIDNAENIDEKNQAIQKNFIEAIFGKRSKNISTILTSNNDEDLEKLYNILNSEKVNNYIIHDRTQIKINNLTEKFHSNIENNNGKKNYNPIEVYVDAILHEFKKINKNVNEFINKLNDNINITNDFARDIKNLLETQAKDRLKDIEDKTQELLNNPYKYFFDNFININK